MPGWSHLTPIPGQLLQADLDCSTIDYPVKLLVGADVDGDGREEVVCAPAAPGTEGNARRRPLLTSAPAGERQLRVRRPVYHTGGQSWANVFGS
jgi:hypothetical protein